MAFKLMTNRAAGYIVLEGDWDALTDNIAALNSYFSLPLFPQSSGQAPSSGLTGAAYSIVQSTGAGTNKPQRSILSFDASTDEGRIWDFEVPRVFGYTVYVAGAFYMASAASGNVALAAQLAAIGDADASVDAKVFDTVTTSIIAVPGAAKTEKQFSIAIADADTDAMASLDSGNLIFYRDADNANDTATGDLQLTRLGLLFVLTTTTV